MIGGVHIDQVGVKLFSKRFDDTLGFILAHQAVVDVHAHQLLADSADQKCRHHRGVHTAAESQQNLLVAHLRTDLGHLLFNKRMGQLRRGDSFHSLGTNITRHCISLHITVLRTEAFLGIGLK